MVNMAFLAKLKEFVPKPGVAELFKEIVCDLYSDGFKFKQVERKKTISEITQNNNRITKARELLLTDSISPEDYKLIKTEAEEKIIRLETTLNDSNAKDTAVNDVEGLVYKAVENLKKLDLLYVSADIKGKREIIGSIFPEKWTFEDGGHRTKKSIRPHFLSIRLTLSYGTKKPD